MCRRNHLRSCLFLGIGIGLLIGYNLDSWALCTFGGVGFVCCGFMALKRG